MNALQWPAARPWLALADDSTKWIIYAMMAVAIVYLALLRPLIKKKKDPLATPAPKFGLSLSQQRAVERDMQHVLVEMAEMARQISAQLDTRSAKLEMLIQEADEKIAELHRLREADRARPTRRSAVLPADDPYDDLRIPPSDPMEDPRYLEIYNLADAGRNVQEIAGALNKPRGEVELILALRGK